MRIKALLKKNLLAFLTSISGKNKKGGKGMPIFMAFIWFLVIVSVGFAFAGMAHALSSVVLPLGLDWLYYTMICIVALAIGIIFNAFLASSMIYNTKDNDLLLSMPLTANEIVFSRVCPLFLLSLLYSALPVIPAMIVKRIEAGRLKAAEIVLSILIIFCLALITTALSSLLGKLIASISKKLKNKSVATTFVILLFLGIYYYVYFNINTYLSKLVEASIMLGEKIEENWYFAPIRFMGHACTGDVLSFLFFFLFSAVIFGAVYAFILASFRKTVTATEAVASGKAKNGEMKKRSIDAALLKKEAKRFVGSSAYMLNCGLGIIMGLAASVILIIKAKDVGNIYSTLLATGIGLSQINEYVLIVAEAVVCLIAATIDTAAPSISLEGENISILKTAPIKAKSVFKAKYVFEILLTLPCVAVMSTVISAVMSFDALSAFSLVLTAVIYTVFHSVNGVSLNLLLPKMEWSNEAEPIKASTSVMVSLLGGMIFFPLFAALYVFVLKACMPAYLFLLLCDILLAGATFAEIMWLGSEKCEKMFKEL